MLLCAAVLLAPPAAAAAPVGLDRILEMVEAGVGDAIILRQVAASRPDFTVGIDEVLRLSEAGASDALIDGLMDLAGTGEPAPADPAPGAGVTAPLDDEPGFRIYRETGADGNPVIHITNLDATGRRMGGPAPDPEPAPHNAYLSRHDDVYVDARETAAPPGGPAATAPPVVVNIFTPDNEPVVIKDESDDPYLRPYVAGYLPGYYGWGRHGRRIWGPSGVPSPPGSYSHYKRYHAGDGQGHGRLYNGGLQYRALQQQGYAVPVPFHTAGAYQLNRMRANVRLGH